MSAFLRATEAVGSWFDKGDPGWYYRRALFYATIIFSGGVILLVINLHVLKLVSESFAIYIAGQAFAVITLTITTYAGFSTLDDNLRRKAANKEPEQNGA